MNPTRQDHQLTMVSITIDGPQGRGEKWYVHPASWLPHKIRRALAACGYPLPRRA